MKFVWIGVISIWRVSLKSFRVIQEERALPLYQSFFDSNSTFQATAFIILFIYEDSQNIDKIKLILKDYINLAIYQLHLYLQLRKMLMRIAHSFKKLTPIRYAFTAAQPKEPFQAFLIHTQIKEKLTQEEYNLLLQQTQQKQAEVLVNHQKQLQRLEILLGNEQKARLHKIEELVSGLNEQEVAFLRYRLLSTVEIEAHA